MIPVLFLKTGCLLNIFRHFWIQLLIDFILFFSTIIDCNMLSRYWKVEWPRDPVNDFRLFGHVYLWARPSNSITLTLLWLRQSNSISIILHLKLYIGFLKIIIFFSPSVLKWGLNLLSQLFVKLGNVCKFSIQLWWCEGGVGAPLGPDSSPPIKIQGVCHYGRGAQRVCTPSFPVENNVRLMQASTSGQACAI